MNTSSILNQLKELYPDVRIYVSEDAKKIYLHNLQVPPEKRGQGFSSNNLNIPQQIEGTWLGVEISVATTIALKDDGTIWGWGLNARGELGNNDVISYSSPIQIGSGMGFWTRVQKCNQTSYGWLF